MNGSPNELRRISVPIYGMATWGDLFAPRQALALTTLASLVRKAGLAAGKNATTFNASMGYAVTRLASTDNPLGPTDDPLASADGPLAPPDHPLVSTDDPMNSAGNPLASPADPLASANLSWTPPDDSLASTGDSRGCRTPAGTLPPDLAEAVATFLGLAVTRFADICNALCMWETTKTQVRHAFTRQAIGMLWDFAEPNVFADAAGNFSVTFGTMLEVLETTSRAACVVGHVEQSSATSHPLPDDSAAAIVTDPPYYDAVPYAYLSDFFYVWLRRTLAGSHPSLFSEGSVPKDAEIVVDRSHRLSQSNKGIAFYECELQKAFAESRRVLRPDGVGTIVFASKTTASWEAILKAVVDAGWVITGSWPIDTEMETRVAAQGQARLASSVHLVCRPREDASGAVTEAVGEWRDVLGELPRRIHEWMPRLAAEGVVGADAIFACLGPALEIFSRYRRVTKSGGEPVPLREYLEEVWAAVSREALALIFDDADTAGLEPDARLTAMWLWTLGAGKSDANGGPKTPHPGPLPPSGERGEEAAEESDDDESDGKKPKVSRYTLEYDAARKIAQGLGIDLERIDSVVEVKGDTARLLPVAERTRYLFGKVVTQDSQPKRGRKKKHMQTTLFEELAATESVASGERGDSLGIVEGPKPGTTVLDRVHQAMILFAAGRGEAMKRFLVEDGAGKDARFWKLADNLTKLYPAKSDERRWVECVLARKKGLGL